MSANAYPRTAFAAAYPQANPPVLFIDDRIKGFYLQDLSGDGVPDVAIIDVNIQTEADRILIFNRTREMAWSDRLDDILCFDDCVWIFDVDSDANANLIVEFLKHDIDGHVARLFDDITGDGQIAYEYLDRSIRITESPTSRLTVEVDGDWFLPDGSLNWNITFYIDGPDIEQRHTYGFSEAWKNYLVFDGQPDTITIFRDLDGDGIPEYGHWRLLADAPYITLPIGKTWIWKNEGQKRPAPHASTLIWPYLVLEPEDASIYFDRQPYVVMDWENRRIQRFSFDGYPVEHGFHVNTFEAFLDDEENYANFENMQAYYDLAQDHDGFPELHIRNVYYGINDRITRLPTAINSIRYSWNTTKAVDLSWDYKIDLAGRSVIYGLEEFSEFAYVTIPYAELPHWVVDNTWDLASFIAVEEGAYVSSEGIYEWSTLERLLDGDYLAMPKYLAGHQEINPVNLFSELPLREGLRGEFALLDGQQAHLYWSPVDNRLHLLGADVGLWSLSDGLQIRLLNLGSGPYLNTWRLEEVITQTDGVQNETSPEPGRVLEQLHQLGQWLLYAEYNRMAVAQMTQPAGELKFLPPVDQASWRAFRDRLAPLTADRRDPLDLFGWLGAAGTYRFTLEGAQVRDLRGTGSGYRFVVEISSSVSLSGVDDWGMSELAPGQYLLEISGESLNVQPLTPASAVIMLNVQGTGHALPTVLVQLQNHGLADLTAAHLQLRLQCPSGLTELAGRQVDLLAGALGQFSFPLPLQIEAGCRLVAWLEDSEGVQVAMQALALKPQGVDPAQLAAVWLASSAGGARLPAFLLLVTAGLLCSTLGLGLWFRGSSW